MDDVLETNLAEYKRERDKLLKRLMELDNHITHYERAIFLRDCPMSAIFELSDLKGKR